MIGIIGVGSIGKNLLDCLIKNNRQEEFVIIDGDVVNAKNIQYNKKSIGHSKVLACNNQYGRNIIPLNEYIEDNKLSLKQQSILKNCSVIFDCRDTFETRISFKAVKLFINKDKLIVDFRKEITFRYDVAGDYVSYIDNTYIKSLISVFVKMYGKDRNMIQKYSDNNKAISINQIGIIEELYPSKNILDTKLNKILESKSCQVADIKVNVTDGLYNIMSELFPMSEYTVKDIVTKVDNITNHFPAIYVVPTISNNRMNLNIMNQTGGA
jgi:hypothetical protein